jgi:hypothetical protein
MRKIIALLISLYLFSFIIPVNHFFCLDTASATAGEDQSNSHSNPGHPQHPVSSSKDKAAGPGGHSCCNLIFQNTASFFSPSSFSFFVPNEVLSYPSEIPQSIFRPPEPLA